MMSLVVARSVGSRELGAFGIAFASYIISLGASRALATEPLVVRFSDSREGWRQAARSSTGTALIVGTCFGLVLLLIALVTEPPLSQALWPLGLGLPGVLLQDAWRFAFFANSRGQDAVKNDAAWGLTLAIAIYFLVQSDQAELSSLIGVWGITGWIASAYGAFQAKLLPAANEAVRWVRTNAALAFRFLGEFGVSTGASQFALYAIGAIAGLSTVGALRAAQIMLGPVMVLFMGTVIAGVPATVRQLRRTPERVNLSMMRFSVALVAAAVTWGLAVMIIPDHLGESVMGPNWYLGRRVLPAVMFGATALAASAGAGIGLRALAAARRSLRARALAAILIVSGGVSGAALASTEGAAWGLALGWTLGLVPWWWEFERGMKDAHPSSGVTAPKGTAEQILPSAEPPSHQIPE